MSVERRENPASRFVFGVVLLGLGVLFWLDQIGRIDASDYVEYWPAILVVIGVASLLNRKWVGGIIWILLGVAFFVPDGGWETIRILLSVWPLLISLGGLTLVLHAIRSSREPDWFHAAAVMAGNVRTASSSGSAVAVMGGCQVDFVPPGGTTGDLQLDVLAFWGGIDVRVPPGWQVEDRVAEIFGGFEDKTVPARENAPRLIVRGSAIMGGVEVKTSETTA